MTKDNTEKLDVLFFIIQNTAGEWTPEQVMRTYYTIEEDLDFFAKENPKKLLSLIDKAEH